MNIEELRLQMGENVRQCRTDRGYTQEVLAENAVLLRHTARKSKLVHA